MTVSNKNLKVMELINKIRRWAVAGSAEDQALTNKYELVRLRVKGGVAIVYRRDNGKTTWNPLAMELKRAFEHGQPFPTELRPVQAVKRDSKTSVTERTLIQRDGRGCFFCFHEKELMTIEHLVPRAHGGPNHIANKFLACEPCNLAAGHLSAPEKIRIREENLLKRQCEKAA